MPRVEFDPFDRVYILKLICTAQMTYSSFMAILYLYLHILQSLIAKADDRPDIPQYKWCVLALCLLDFGIGTLLAFAANMRGICCKRRMVVWIIFETVYIPVAIFLLMRLYYELVKAKSRLDTDVHYIRIVIAQVMFTTCHFLFAAYVLDFLAQKAKKPKVYDPSIRPESVYAPTDPQITTTESRHIRMSQSILFQPSTSRGVPKNQNNKDPESESLE